MEFGVKKAYSTEGFLRPLRLFSEGWIAPKKGDEVW